MFILGITAEMSILSADQNLIEQKCTRCHSAKNPDSYSKEEWKYNVERMSQKAGLTSAELQSMIDLNKKK